MDTRDVIKQPMSGLRIGTAGIPKSAPKRSAQAGIIRVAELGLGCMELEFVRSVQMKEKTAAEVKKIAETHDVHLTVHAPYYVNLNSKDENKVTASKHRVLQAARIGAMAGALSVTFHPGFYHDDSADHVFAKVRKHLADMRSVLDDEGIGIDLRPETTGSLAQFGTLVEILQLSQEIPGVYPCIDFSHLHARTGDNNTYEEFAAHLELVQRELGLEALGRLHMHLSGIDYGPRGEKKHLLLRESDMNYRAVLQALIDFGVCGWLICESPEMEDDALHLQETYAELLDKT